MFLSVAASGRFFSPVLARANRAGGIYFVYELPSFEEIVAMAAFSSSDVVKVIQRMVRAKHAKNHPIMRRLDDGPLAQAKAALPATA